MRNIIEVKGIKKSFGDKVVVNDISFSVDKGTLFAFLGQNGAGKTTTINMIIGLLNKECGEILYDGSIDFKGYKNKIGVVFQNNVLDDLLTVEENLLTHGALYIKSHTELKKRFNEVVELLDIGAVIKQHFKTLSGGQKRKAEIARALFTSPEILFLDEPTTGLDPKTRAEVWNIINTLKKESGMTIFLTTHYMEETASADNVAVIDKGKIIAQGTPAELKAEYTFDKLMITPRNDELFNEQLGKFDIRAQKIADTYTIKIANVEDSIIMLYEIKDNIKYYEVIRGSMDDVFLNIVGEKVKVEK